MACDRVLEDTPASRELQEKVAAMNQSESARPSASFETFCGPKRLDAMAAWMNSVDDALARLHEDVRDLTEHQVSQDAQLMELERRKKGALEEKAKLEAAVLKDLKRVRVAEETAMARRRLQNAGVSQDEIDAILPVIPHAG
ncbi:Esa1p-associated factor [Phytophthora pseudosyringae]|uniref:Esa1p-associated factor n=1 Tax=Phytophthora pseudosyringae TaxID=221518 RepID=A0A8T1VSM2_9STRA|nr:Esa1p-associated factor [Phytophthora pseudosyringae]